MMEKQSKQRHYGRNIGFGCLGLIALFIVLAIGVGVSTHQDNTPTASTSVAGTVITQDTPPVLPTVKPTTQLKWVTTHTYSGNGSKNTTIFTIPGHFKLTWKCDPTSSYSGSYNVIIDIYSSTGQYVTNAINTICQVGNISGETELYGEVGSIADVYLAVTSEGSWNISIQEQE